MNLFSLKKDETPRTSLEMELNNSYQNPFLEKSLIITNSTPSFNENNSEKEKDNTNIKINNQETSNDEKTIIINNLETSNDDKTNIINTEGKNNKKNQNVIEREEKIKLNEDENSEYKKLKTKYSELECKYKNKEEKYISQINVCNILSKHRN